MWLSKKKPVKVLGLPIFLNNTLTDKKEVFTPIKPGLVTMYSCGPTVYDRASIGNLRAYVFSDTLARVLLSAGYHVRRVINITDVGHMVGDAEMGEDKMALGARLAQKTPAEIADHYTKLFIEDIQALNIDTENILFPRATEYMREQIAMVQTLEEKGYAYSAGDGMYFDTAKFAGYGKLGGVNDTEQHEGARIATNDQKHSPHDFALWRFAKTGDLQQWDSPWGRGNPGWHIECSAMSRSLLGIELDIHTGGMDHISVHHNNEIAQSEAVSQRPFVHYWLHNAFLTMEGEKISKSLGNVFYISDVIARGYHPLALRYFFLQAHYRSPLAFSWESLGASNEALMRLWRACQEIKKTAQGKSIDSDARKEITALLHDDLGTPQAIAFLWNKLKDEEYTPAERFGMIEIADAILGLMLVNPPLAPMLTVHELPKEVQELAQKRETARKAKDYAESDRLRAEIENSGYRVEDQGEKTLFTKVSK